MLGIASNGWIVEAVITPDGRWTMIATDINGISCFLGAGSKWTYPVPLGFETNY